MSFSLGDKELEYSKWKVADLRKELKSRGLNSEGKKNELIERLQLATGDGDAALLDDAVTDHDDILDEDVLTDEEEPLEDTDLSKLESPEKKEEKETPPVAGLKRPAAESSNGTVNKQAKKITLNRSLVVVEKDASKTEGKENKGEETEKHAETSEKREVIKVGGLSEKERLEKRAAKFGVAMSNEAKKEARAARFGLPAAGSKVGGIVNTNVDVLKKRAERFGTTPPGSILEKAEIEERKKKREERFGKVENSSASKPGEKTEVKSASTDEKKRLRAERFKITL